jgi:hypothetical protein
MIVLSLILSLLLNAVDTTASNPNDPSQTECYEKDGPSFIIITDIEP